VILKCWIEPQGSAKVVTGTPEKLQYSAAWRDIETAFHATGRSAPVLAGLTAATDAIVRDAFGASVERALPQSAAMLAVGTYGRGETFPYSGADIVILLDAVADTDAIREAKAVFARVLWDAGLRLNYSVRTLADCLETREQNLELTISLLDRRFLAGDDALRARLDSRLPPTLARGAKQIALRLHHSAHARHAKHGSASQRLEPDIKESPGGLRDLRLLDWLAKLFPDLEPGADLSEARQTVATARCFLHYRAGRDSNLLDFDAQAALARPPFSVVMRDYFRGARLVFDESRRALEFIEKHNSSLVNNFHDHGSRLSNAEFTVGHERLLLRAPGHLESDPEMLLRVMEFVGRHGVPLAHETKRRLEAARDRFTGWFATPRSVWPALKEILSSPHAAMAARALHDTGCLAAVLPEWADVAVLPLALPDRLYTADEHALRCLDSIEALPAAADAARNRFAGVLSELDQWPLAAFALLFADVAPARVRAAATRIQMPVEDQDTVRFLIERTGELPAALTRDIGDPATIAQIAHRVDSVERLKLLTILVYAGICAAEVEAVTPYRLEQLWRVYTVTRQELTRELETERIEQPPVELPEAAEFIKGFPTRYVRAHSSSEIAAQYQLYERSRPTGAAVQLDAVEGGYRLTIVARDRPYLFASFAAAITSFGLDILKAEAFSNDRGLILDSFVFADPKHMLRLNPSEVERLRDLAQRVALGKTDAQRLMRGVPLPNPNKRTVPPEVRFDSASCETATLVEIVTDDRRGLLYSLATVFSTTGCNIDVVLIDTKGNRAIDVFYVAQEGRKLSPEMEAVLREKLLAAC
jgi:[protein-PII] uridylyltransferase